MFSILPIIAAAFIASEGGEELRLYQTTASKDFREITTSGFTIHSYPAAPALDVDKAKPMHEFLGLGGAMTDASAWILANMPKEKREKLMKELFTPEGCNLSTLRLCIGASDYSTALYSYNDTPGDVEMKNFSLARDDNYLVPMVKSALAIQPDMYIFASPWSPPAWMKNSNLMISGQLKDDSMGALANYFVRYVEEYDKRGIKISAVSPQNETMCETGGQYPCCTYTAEKEGVFVRDYLSKAFKKSGLNTKIWVHDHDPDKRGIERVKKLMAIDGVSDAIDGIAWHCYCNPKESESLAPLKAAYADKGFYHTENGPHVVVKERTEFWWAAKVFGMLQNGCTMFTTWNICLDELGTPATGAHLCGGFTVVDSATSDVTYSPQYKLFRHIGPFVKRGARIMEVEGFRDGTRLILFRNPDGQYVLVVASDGSFVRGKQRRRIVVKYKGKYKTLPLPGAEWSVSTLIFK